MFSVLTRTGKLALRLPDGVRERFLSKYRTQLCEQNGVVMKEYAEVPAALLRRTAELRKYFAHSFAWASSLKPKPSAKKRK
jgi:TfoX/Sxy family transcriptional regulator of competence genes